MKQPQHHYVSQNADGPIASLKCVAKGEGFLTFVTVAYPSPQLDETLKAAGLSQEISRTAHAGGELRVMKSTLAPQELLARLSEQGIALTAQAPEKKKFDPWVWRGITSIVGQSLTFFSGFYARDEHGKVPDSIKADRSALMSFAALNMVANVTNMTFGSQKKEDPYQLRLLKNQVNDILQAHTGNSIDLPDVEDKRLLTHKEQEPKKTTGQSAYDAIQKVSVSGGEIGLRTLGATALVFPIKNFGKALAEFRGSKSIVKTYHVAKNGNPTTVKAGLLTLAGKAVSFLSKEPDPFNPTPPSTLDSIREKITFPSSSVLEGIGAGLMSHDRFTRQYTAPFNGKLTKDYYGGVGNLVFIGGYGIRFTAPYGSLAPHMPELYAHTADALARVPKEQIPERVADIALMLESHFASLPKGKTVPPECGEIYAAIAEKLERYHGITLVPRAHETAVPAAPPATQGPAVADAVAAEKTEPKPARPSPQVSTITREAETLAPAQLSVA